MSNVRRVLSNIKRRAGGVCLDRPADKPTVLLTSSGRSGSTWLQELISQTDRFRVMFEPFHAKEIPALSDWEFRQYIDRDEPGDRFYPAAARILGGRIRHPWIDQFNRARFPRRRLIKDIRTNLMAAWIGQRFAHVKVVLLLRHPFDVAISRQRIGWGANLRMIDDQHDLMDRHFPDRRDFFANISDPFAQQVALWAVENLVPLRELGPDEAAVIAYEDLKQDPQAEFQRVADFLGIDANRLTPAHFQRPSKTSKYGHQREAHVTDAQRELAFQQVLVPLGLDRIYPTMNAEPPALHARDVLTEFTTPNTPSSEEPTDTSPAHA